MKNNTNSFMQWVRNHRKIILFIGLLCIVFIGWMMIKQINKEEVITLKQREITSEVDHKIDPDVTLYLDGLHAPKQAITSFEEVDISKLGKYNGEIAYKDSKYPIIFHIVDTTKPTITIVQNSYTFSLDKTIEEVNTRIEEDITISDNYDKEFETLRIVSEIPESEKEVHVELSLKDTSNNESNKITITIQFTKDGKSKEGLEEEKKIATISVLNATTDTPSTSQHETALDNNPSNPVKPENEQKPLPPVNENKPEQVPLPEPDSKPVPPLPAPSEPEYTLPTGAIEIGIFNIKEQGRDACHKLTRDPNSSYYDWSATGLGLSTGSWVWYITEY